MKVFLLATFVVYAALTGFILVMDRAVAHDGLRVWYVVLNACILPALAAWAGAEAARALRNARLFACHGPNAPVRFSVGVFVGLLGIVLIISGLSFTGNGLMSVWSARSDVWITAPCGFASALLVVLPWPRVRPGRCPHCRYDLTALTTACKGLCPECGTDLMCVP